MTSVILTLAVCPTLAHGASISGDLVLGVVMTDTLVIFASGGTTGRGQVVRTVPLSAGGPLVVVDTTPFHPVDHAWPDQPGDKGWIDDQVVIDSVMVASGPGGDLLVAADIPVKRGEPGWSWHVAHRLAENATLPEVGTQVQLAVDAERRRALSAAHTACHLAALAMNGAAAHLWRKEVRLDSLGNPDLDQLAMDSSVMDEDGSTDIYRFGKSLRKRGFDSAGFADQIEAIVAGVRARLETWIATRAQVVIIDGGDQRVTALRHWTCALPEGLADIACGGTHVSDLGAFSAVRVAYELAADGTGLTVRTTPSLAA